MSDRPETPAPVLVLGIGNLLLGDDGAGLQLLERLAADIGAFGGDVELVDGGTQGLALLGVIAHRKTLIILDAVQLGGAPGTVHVKRGMELLRLGHVSATAHEGNAGEMLRASMLLGDLPEHMALIGVEPARLKTGIGLSDEVRRALPVAAMTARAEIAAAVERLNPSRRIGSVTD